MKTTFRLGLGAAVTGVLLVAGPVTWMAVANGAPATAGTAGAAGTVSDPEPVSGQVLSQAVLAGGVRGMPRGTADLTLVTLTIRPGAEGGWHSHAGPSIVSIVAGEASFVERTPAGCVTRLVPAGRAILERPGQVHTIRNAGAADLVLTAFVAAPHKEESSHDEHPARGRGCS